MDRRTLALAVILGLTVPAMISGRAVLQGLAALALILVCNLAFTDREIVRRSLATLRSTTGILMIAAFLGLSFSIWTSLDPWRSFDAWARTILYAGGCVLFWAFLTSRPEAHGVCERTLVAATLFGGIVASLSVHGIPLPLQILKAEFGEVNIIWWQLAPKTFSAAAACVIPILLLLTWRFKKRWSVVAVVAIATIIVAIIGTANKSALAGLLAMIVICGLLYGFRAGGNRPWLALGAVAVGAPAILIAVFLTPEPPPTPNLWDWMPAWLIDGHRQHIWSFTASKFTEAPWTGHGLNVIDRVAGAAEIPEGYRFPVLPSHPHNWVLEILAEAGVIGFAPVLAALTVHVLYHAGTYLRSGDDRALTLVALAAVFWASSLFNFSIWSSWWLITFFLLTAMVAAAPPPHTEHGHGDDPGPTGATGH